ncbi:transcriptional regulator [Streptomyces lunaelactis]|uniref:Transcriptional regulator n=1 Tax=Streptomyces lunaelactis TaxID=1535768 RepID=A0A2R4T6F6_9ACTN|nr:transcriptional regulator [Streptomyces lunaelactis]NUK86491.1 helix-turn-helix domain-containing protein [Streptomyces lunaelactis]
MSANDRLPTLVPVNTNPQVSTVENSRRKSTTVNGGWGSETVEESQAYIEAGYAFALGLAVYDRRTELGLTQTELARRAEMTQPQISNIEGGDSVPTLPLLTRLAKALDASLTIDLEGDTSAFAFNAHDGHQPDESSTDGRTSAA